MASPGDSPLDDSARFAMLSQMEADGVSEGEGAVSPVRPKFASFAKTLLVSALAIAMVICATTFAVTKLGRQTSNHMQYVAFSDPAFVSYVGTPVAPTIPHSTPLCDTVIVQEMCQRMNLETTENWGSALDADPNYVHALEISEALSVSKAAVVDMLFDIRVMVARNDANTDAYAIHCQALCEKLVSSFPENEIAERSDVACFRDPEGLHAPVCDIDVSPDAMSKIHFSQDAKTEAAAYLENQKVGMKGFNQGTPESQGQGQALNDIWHPNPAEATQIANLDFPVKVDPRTLKTSLLNLFRIYPVTNSIAVDNSGPNQFFNVAPKEPARRLATVNRVDTCTNARDGACDEPTYCPWGTDCTDCGNCGALGDWKATTLRLAAKSKAYVASALASMEGRQIPNVVLKWFGNNLDSPTRTEVKRVLNGVHAMLGNVDYVYPGDQCQPNTYAYVYPSPPWNKNSAGQFVFHLCNYYMLVPDGEKIETLTHEGSHHLTMQVADSVYQGSTMYGRASCENVAAQCKAGDTNACTLALRNADSFCYFINDAAAASQASGGVVDSTPTANTGPTAAPFLCVYGCSDTADAASHAAAAADGGGLFASLR